MGCVLKQSCLLVTVVCFLLNEVNASSITLEQVLTSSMEEVYTPRPNLYNRVKSRITGRVTPVMFGARGDGIADDTAPIQYAINYAAKHHISEVRIPAGTYNINITGHNSVGKILSIDGEPHYFDMIGAGIMAKSGVDIILDKEAILQAIPSDLAEYAVVYIGEQENVILEGGTIIGDLDKHLGTTGQQGMCVWIQSSSNITIKNCDISKGWGDCIDVGCKWDNDIPYGSNRSRNVTIKNCKLHHSRRQGISAVGCEGLLVKDCEIYNIEGDAPQAGIDLEVNFKDYPNRNCLFEGLDIHDCKGGGIIGYTTPTSNVEIRKSNIQSIHLSCVDGIKVLNSTVGYATFDNYYHVPNDTVSITGCTIKSITLYSASAYNLMIDGCVVGNDENQPTIAFVKRPNNENLNEVVDISVNNSTLSATL